MFQGHPNDLTQILQDIGLKCPMYTSLSDYILEVASGDFGNKSLQTLSHYNNEMNKKRFSDDFNEVEMNSLREAVKRAHLGDQRYRFPIVFKRVSLGNIDESAVLCSPYKF